MISHAFSLHFPDKAPLALWWCFTVTVLYWCMEFSVTDLMNHGLDGLHLAHIRLHQNALLYEIAAAIGSAGKGFDVDRIGGESTNCLGHTLVVRHISGQLMDKLRQRLSLGLAHIEHGDCPKTYALHQLDGRGCGAVWGRFLHFLPSAVRAGGEYGDATLASLDLSAKIPSPIVITRNMGGIWALHENQHGIAKAIMVEFRHGSKISCVLTALKNI